MNNTTVGEESKWEWCGEMSLRTDGKRWQRCRQNHIEHTGYLGDLIKSTQEILLKDPMARIRSCSVLGLAHRNEILIDWWEEVPESDELVQNHLAAVQATKERERERQKELIAHIRQTNPDLLKEVLSEPQEP